jgi:hypothetical protein
VSQLKMELVIGNGGIGNRELLHLFLSLNTLNSVPNSLPIPR